MCMHPTESKIWCFIPLGSHSLSSDPSFYGHATKMREHRVLKIPFWGWGGWEAEISFPVKVLKSPSCGLLSVGAINCLQFGGFISLGFSGCFDHTSLG